MRSIRRARSSLRLQPSRLPCSTGRKLAATSFVGRECNSERSREHGLARRPRQRRRREHRVLDRPADGVVAVALPHLRAHDVAGRQLHDVDQALDAGACAQRRLPVPLHVVFDHEHVLVEKTRRTRGVRLGLGRDLRLQLRLGLLPPALLGRPLLGFLAVAARLRFRFLLLALLRRPFVGEALLLFALRVLARALLGGDALLLALIGQALLLGRFAPLPLLALLLLPFLPRRRFLLGLLALDG